MAATPTDLSVALARRHQTALNRIRSTTAARAAAVWDAMPTLAGNGIDTVLTDALGPIIQAGLDAAATLTDAYVAQAIGIGTGQATAPLGATARTISELRGVASDHEVLRRPLVQLWKALGDGVPYADAAAAGRARLEELASTSVQLAMKDSAEQYSDHDGVKGWQRTLTGKSCSLCAVASTQRYKTPRLMPIHGHCDCGIAPLTGKVDPGQIINKDRYDELSKSGAIDEITAKRALPKAQVALDNARTRVDELRAELAAGIPDQERETRVEQRLSDWQGTVTKRESRVAMLTELKDKPLSQQIVTHQHGELGPVLYNAQHAFDPAA